MATAKHLELLKEGVSTWNKWRVAYPNVRPILAYADLHKAVLCGADLHDADLRGASLIAANLSDADLRNADLSGADLFRSDMQRATCYEANLRRANLREADMHMTNIGYAVLHTANLSFARLSEASMRYSVVRDADLRNADLRKAYLHGADLTNANFTDADLTGANLSRTRMISTNFERAILDGCLIYGISAWDVTLREASQSNLVVSPKRDAALTVDNLEIAQVIYLLLNNERFRDVLQTIATKVVLILGRFSDERKVILDQLREKLRGHNYVPVLLDFEKPVNRDLSETVSTTAHLARFIIADVTDPRSVPHELQSIVPGLRVPVQLIIQEGDHGYAMMHDLKKYPWVLPEIRYRDAEQMVTILGERVIALAEAKVRELQPPESEG